MTLPITRSALTLACLVVFAPAPSTAQTPSTQWPGLTPSKLQTVFLRDRSGTEVSGKLIGLDTDSLRLLVNGSEQRFEKADVDRIQTRDSLKNGTLIGAAVGLLAGIVAAGISDCPGDDPGGHCAGFRAAALVFQVGIYAGAGAGIDALIKGRTTIYAAPGSSGARGRGQSPRAALRMGVSW